MRISKLSRSEFIAWLGAHTRDRAAAPPVGEIKGKGAVTLVWADGFEEAQPIIAVEADEMRDFLAFVATYVGTYVPFTAFFRVVPSALTRSLPDTSARFKPDLLAPLIGAVICDAAVQIGSQTRAADISLQACLATPSAAVCRASLLTYEPHLCEMALRRWFSVRNELLGPNLKIHPEEMILFWGTALDSLSSQRGFSESDQSKIVSEFVGLVRETSGIATDNAWSKIAPIIPAAREFSGALRSTREDRVRALAEVARLLRQSAAPELSSMLLGYFVAQIADGSMNYLSLACSVEPDRTSVPLWFGLFSGLNPNTDIMTAGECLGRRVARRLSPLAGFGAITADFSYEEFLLYLQEGRIDRVRTDNQSILEIELLPGVNGRYRINRPSRPVDEKNDSRKLQSALRHVLQQLQFIVQELERAPPTSSDLFERQWRQEEESTNRGKKKSSRREGYTSPKD